MPFNSVDFSRLDAPNSLGASSSGVAFATSTGDLLELSSHGPGIFRLRVGPDTRPDYGILQSHSKSCTVAQPTRGTWTLTSADAAFELTGKPLSFRLLHKGVVLLTSSGDLDFDGTSTLPIIGRLQRGEQWTIAFALASGEPVYGLGEKFGALDKRGQLVHSHIENAPGVNAGYGARNTPFAWGYRTNAAGAPGAWGVFVHTPGRVTHGVGYPDWSHRSYALVVDDEALDVFLFAAATPAGVLDLYTQLTGRAAAVPLWSLGLCVSSAHFGSPHEATAVAANLRRQQIPCDALLLGGRSAWNPDTCASFQWDPLRFPDTRSALAPIKAQGFKVGLSEFSYVSAQAPLFHELAALEYLICDADGEPCIVGSEETEAGVKDVNALLRESAIIDFTNPAAFEWWCDAHEALFAAGVDVIGIECSEPLPDHAAAFNGDSPTRLHNVYALLHDQCVRDATAKFQQDGNLALLFATAGWSGCQRFPVHGAGTAQNDWEGLAASIRGALSWGMSGVPCHSSVVGDVYGPDQPTPELYVRWLQAALFGSHLRIHGINEADPWLYEAGTLPVVRKWLAFRYRLIPYLQHLIAESLDSGLPVMRAMALAFPGNALVRDYETQFMCGDSLLVAPIIRVGGEVEIALPPGTWHDLNSRRRFSGQRVLRYKAALDQFPVFGREGHALPLGAAVQHTGEIDAEHPLAQLWVFGTPTQAMNGYAQVTIAPNADGTMVIHAAPEVKVQTFGDAAPKPGEAPQ